MGLLELFLGGCKFGPSLWPLHSLPPSPGVVCPHFSPWLDLDISFTIASFERPSLDTQSKEAASELFPIAGTSLSLHSIQHWPMLLLFICVCFLPNPPYLLTLKYSYAIRDLVCLAHHHILSSPSSCARGVEALTHSTQLVVIVCYTSVTFVFPLLSLTAVPVSPFSLPLPTLSPGLIHSILTVLQTESCLCPLPNPANTIRLILLMFLLPNQFPAPAPSGPKWLHIPKCGGHVPTLVLL